MRRNREQWAAVRKMRTQFHGALAGVGLSACALLCIPFLGNYGSGSLPTSFLIVGITFWLGILLEALCYILAAMTKARYKRAAEDPEQFTEGPVGMIGFLRNREARIADIALLLSLVWLILTIALSWSGAWQIILSVTAFFISLQLHGALNGRIYEILRSENHHRKGERNNDEKP
ncbi:MAG: hypothetical protein J6K89_06995 [Oscillospiraceae bacterium]|nr:hypothetical protein [Oscillospiraceae bacterium]